MRELTFEEISWVSAGSAHGGGGRYWHSLDGKDDRSFWEKVGDFFWKLFQ